MDKYKILVVDDDKEIRNVLIRLLNENYTVIGASSAHDAMLILDKTYSLVILDIMMPEKDGVSTCIDIRKKYFMPILFLTAKNTENDKHISLSVGGDDFLEKPFSKVELLARVSSLIRRYHIYQNTSQKSAENYVYIKDLKIDKQTTRVFKEKDEILLTNIEYKLLMLFVNNPNKIFTLENIYESIWNESYDYSVNALIMVHIRNLRKKLGDTSRGTQYIKNIWGRGYCIEI